LNHLKDKVLENCLDPVQIQEVETLTEEVQGEDGNYYSKVGYSDF
jgi:DNA-binding protein